MGRIYYIKCDKCDKEKRMDIIDPLDGWLELTIGSYSQSLFACGLECALVLAAKHKTSKINGVIREEEIARYVKLDQ